MSIESIEARLVKATPGKWEVEGTGIYERDEGWLASMESFQYGDCDAEFAAHAHQDIPLLLAIAKAAKNIWDLYSGDYTMGQVRDAFGALDAALADLERGE